MARIDLASVIDLAARLDDDASIDPERLRLRDRDLGAQLGERVGQGSQRIAAWLGQLGSGEGPSPGERAVRAQRAVRAGLALLGAATGAATAAAVYAYDGSQPVNVVQVLAVFVALQMLLLLASGILALPDAWRRSVPALAAIQDLLALASPGRWQPALRRLLPQAERESLDRAIGLAQRHQRLYGDVQKWTLLLGSQWFALAFNLAAIAAVAGLVTFSDLAFGWSTTLEIDDAAVHGVTRALALPWTRGCAG